jgi:hypothetical protein
VEAMKNKLNKKQEELADRVFLEYYDLAKFGATYILGQIDETKSAESKLDAIMSGMMSFACTVIGREVNHEKR